MQELLANKSNSSLKEKISNDDVVDGREGKYKMVFMVDKDKLRTSKPT